MMMLDLNFQLFLGTKRAVEEFRYLSPDIAKERLRALASMMDKNLDEKIDKKELQVIQQESHFSSVVIMIEIEINSNLKFHLYHNS